MHCIRTYTQTRRIIIIIILCTRVKKKKKGFPPSCPRNERFSVTSCAPPPWYNIRLVCSVVCRGVRRARPLQDEEGPYANHERARDRTHTPRIIIMANYNLFSWPHTHTAQYLHNIIYLHIVVYAHSAAASPNTRFRFASSSPDSRQPVPDLDVITCKYYIAGPARANPRPPTTPFFPAIYSSATVGSGGPNQRDTPQHRDEHELHNDNNKPTQ